MLFSEYYPDYFTATILEWKHLLKPEKYKEIIISSLEFLVKEQRIVVYAFCIMSSHIHVIWQVKQGYKPKEIQLAFMKYTAQMIIKDLRNNHKEVLEKFLVKAIDRKYQVWERNALSVALWTQAVFKQKLQYIHANPVVAGLCGFPEDYKYFPPLQVFFTCKSPIPCKPDTRMYISSCMLFSEYYPDYFTATILEWKHLLKPEKYKEIIISSLEFLVKEQRIVVYAFCIMSSHIHVIWQVQQDHKPKEIQLAFMKYTAQMIIKDLRNNHKEVLEKFLVKAIDRKYQVWERNALSVSLWTQAVFKQKLQYIHANPVVAGLCGFPEDYKYSSAAFYEKGVSEWKFITHYSA